MRALPFVALVASSVATLAQTSPAQNTASSQTAALSGVIVDGTTNRPISGAIVSILPERGTSISILTDDLGRFVVMHLPAGSIGSVRANKFGYLDGAYGTDEPNSTGRALALSVGQWLQVRIKLWRTSSISGTVFDEYGDPMVGVSVRPLMEVAVAGARQIAAGPAVVTDDRGMYRIANLARGSYVVQVPSVQVSVPTGTSASVLNSGQPPRDGAVSGAIEAGASLTTQLVIGTYAVPSARSGAQAYPLLYYPAARAIGDASRIDVDYGLDLEGIDLRLTPVATWRVTGHLNVTAASRTDFFGSRVPTDLTNLALRLLPAGDRAGHGGEVATTLVAADGRFVFLNVPAGVYDIDAGGRASEFQFGAPSDPWSSLPFLPRLPLTPGTQVAQVDSRVMNNGPAVSLVNTQDHLNRPLWGGTRIQVDERDVDNVIFDVSDGVSLAGSLAFDQDTPVPAFPISITAEPVGDGTPPGARSTVILPPTRRFTLDGLLPGRYALRVSIGHDIIVRSIAWEGRDYSSTAFDTAAGHEYSNVVVTMTSRAARIVGTVRTARGELAPHSLVLCFPVDRTRWPIAGEHVSPLQIFVVNNSGEYTSPPLSADEYFLVAVSSSEKPTAPSVDFLDVASRVATRIYVNWSEQGRQDLRLQRVTVR